MATRKKTTVKATAGLSFNHAMVYSQDVGRALGFYRDLLGCKVIEDMDYGGRKVYARLKAAQATGRWLCTWLSRGRRCLRRMGFGCILRSRNWTSFVRDCRRRG